MPDELSRSLHTSQAPLADDPAWQAWADRMRGRPEVAAALSSIGADDASTLADQIALARIPAPPFAEGPRGEAMAARMTAAGLEQVTTDAVGNVVGRVAGSPRDGLPLVVAAHLDTVFGPEVDVRIETRGDLIVGPGIGDDARGLAALLALARAIAARDLRFGHPVLVVATVGEEGAGDLRGVRHLFGRDGALAGGCTGFISLDGPGIRRIVTRGVGSRRWRVTVSGPGGHSWIDAGTPNPMHALARAVADFSQTPLPGDATFTTGRWGGGTSVNAIPGQGWVELELRATDEAVLASLEGDLRQALIRAAADVSDLGSGARLEVEVASLGRRPAGTTPETSPLVRAAAAATRVLGVPDPEPAASSTDANLPMSLGIPAITLGAGGEGGLAHTPGEWYRNVEGPRGVARALLTLMLADAPRPSP